MGRKTAVYISHRLSSCRFCEKIAVFHEGELVQLRSHKELAADKTGNTMSCGARRRSITRRRTDRAENRLPQLQVDKSVIISKIRDG